MRQFPMLVLIAAVFAVAQSSVAAGKPRKRESAGGWGGYGLYGARFNFGELNRQLQAIAGDFTSCSDFQFMHGGGGLAQMGSVTIGGYGFGGEQSCRSAARQLLLKAHYGGGFFEAGWLPVNLRHFKFGPGLGIGGAGFTLQAMPTTAAEIGFDSLLVKGDGSRWTITNGSVMLAPTLNVIVPVSWIGITLKAGYLWTPTDKEWHLEDGPSVVPAPRLGSSGIFASLQLLFGGSNEGRKAKVKIEAESKPGEEEEAEPDQE